MHRNLIASFVVATLAAPAFADFSGDYAPANWTLDAFGDGFVAQHDANTLVLVGPDDGGGFGFTDLYITVPQAGTISFDWAYSSSDDPGFDAGFYFAGGFVFLSDTDGESGSVLGVPVAPLDFFAFSVESFDSDFGPGVLTITNFQFVPAPGTASLIALGGLVAVRRRR